MNITLIITGLCMGGAERQVCDLADGFSALGHQVMLISLTGDAVTRPCDTNVQVIELKMPKTPLGLLKAYSRARNLLRSFKPDIVHSHMVHANLFARLLRLSVRIPRLICTAHSKNEGGAARMLAYRLTDSLCDLTTNVSQEAVDAFIVKKAAPLGRVHAIHNGIDINKFIFSEAFRADKRNEIGLSSGTPLILAVGRLTKAKDYPNLLQAFSLLPSEYSHVCLAIIGGGEEEETLKAMVVSLGLEERVTFLGLRRDVNHWMSAADLFVLSSAWEGFGLVVAEAMACERVVVATDCGGVKEVVGDAGFLVKPGVPQELSAALINALLLSSEEKLYLGNSARQRIVKHYSIKVICDNWISLYDESNFHLK